MVSTLLKHQTTLFSSKYSNEIQRANVLMESVAQEWAPGYLGSQFVDHLQTGGKRLRARLALATADALGTTKNSIIEWAAAIELLHNATLIHDDIQDGDQYRRGTKTLWQKIGMSQAINTADYGLMLPYLVISNMDIKPTLSVQLSSIVSQHAIQAAIGQSLGMRLLPERTFDQDSYRSCVQGTTGAFFSLPVQGVAMIAGIDQEQSNCLGQRFMPIGILFQIQDDIIDLFGQKGREAPGNDLKEGKVSALVVEHLRRKPKDAEWLVPLLELDRALTTQTQISRATTAFRRSGALQACLDSIEEIATCVYTDPQLSEYPQLHGLAMELVELICQSIRHLR